MEPVSDAKRIPLNHFLQPVVLGSAVYEITKLLGQGSTCMVYEAWRADEYGGSRHRVILKEFCPHGACRMQNGSLEIPQSVWNAEEWKRFHQSYELYKTLFAKDTLNQHIVQAHALIGGPFAPVNGTAYLEVDYSSGMNMQEYIGKQPPLSEFLAAMKGLVDTLARLHKLKYICTDLKPANLLYFQEGIVQILDADALVARAAFSGDGLDALPATAGFSAPEVLRFGGNRIERQRLSQIGERADVYSVGAIFYWYLFGRTPGKHPDLQDALDHRLAGQSGNVIRLIREFLEHTLEPLSYNRWESMEKIMAALDRLVFLVDGKTPHIHENFYPNPQQVFGREKQLRDLKELFGKQTASGRVVAIYGLGGIGKSTLARHFAEVNVREYDVIVEVAAASFQDVVKEIEIDFWEPDAGHFLKDFFQQKLDQLKYLTGKQRTLILVHDYNTSEGANQRQWQTLNADIILTSRHNWQSTLPTLALKCSDLSPEAAVDIFTDHYLLNAANPQWLKEALSREQTALQELLSRVDHHPLTIKLLARQMAANEQAPDRALAQISEIFAPQNVSCIPNEGDSFVTEKNLHGHLTAIFALQKERLSAQALSALRYMCLIPSESGISPTRFQKWTDLPVTLLHQLSGTGWLEYYPGRRDLLDRESHSGIYTMPMVIQEVLGSEPEMACTTENIRPFLNAVSVSPEVRYDTIHPRLEYHIQQIRLIHALAAEETRAFAQLLACAAAYSMHPSVQGYQGAGRYWNRALHIFSEYEDSLREQMKCCLGLSQCFYAQNDLVKQLFYANKGLKIHAQLNLSKDDDYVELRTCQILVQWQAGRMNDTVTQIKELIAEFQGEPWYILPAMNRLGHCLLQCGHWQEAEELLYEIVQYCTSKIRDAANGQKPADFEVFRFHYERIFCFSAADLGELYWRIGYPERTMKLLKQLYKDRSHYTGTMHPDVARYLRRIADAAILISQQPECPERQRLELLEEAVQIRSEALKIYQNIQDIDSVELPCSVCMLELSLDYRDSGKEDLAAMWVKSALASLRRLPEAAQVRYVPDILILLYTKAEAYLNSRRVPQGLRLLEYRAELRRRLYGRSEALAEEYRALAEMFALYDLQHKKDYWLMRAQNE